MTRWPSLRAPIAAFTIGLLNTTGEPPLMTLSVLAPVLAAIQPTRARAGLSAVAYYAACMWPALVVICNYVGAREALFLGPAICFAGSCVLALPFWALWSHHRRRAAWIMPFAMLLSAVPPFGIIAIGHPLMVSGLLFPGSRWLGVVLTLALPSALLIRPKNTLVGAALASAFFHLHPPHTPRVPYGWAGINMTTSCSLTAVECDFHSLSFIREHAEVLTGGVLVFPEASIRDWNDATELFWRGTNDLLRQRSATVVIGAILRSRGTIRNAVIVRGAETNTFVQRVPVPVGMWRPFKTGTYEMNLTGPASIVVRGRRMAVLICYEQLIPWTWLSAMVENPRIVSVISNDTWSRGTPIRDYRATVSGSWSSLFGIPVVRAVSE